MDIPLILTITSTMSLVISFICVLKLSQKTEEINESTQEQENTLSSKQTDGLSNPHKNS